MRSGSIDLSTQDGVTVLRFDHPPANAHRDNAEPMFKSLLGLASRQAA